MFRILILSTVFLMPANFVMAQSASDMTTKLQMALKQDNADLALEMANNLYGFSVEVNDHKSAGFAAFAKASILEQRKQYVAAAKAYDYCSNHYRKLNSAAQSIQCEYKSGLSFLAGYKKGQAIDALKSAAERLEKIGQDKSGLASQVYLALADETLPAKLERSRGASVKRLASAEYAEKSLKALKSLGQTKSENYASALFLKGLALEDAEKFEDAIKTYQEAINVYKKIPNRSDDVLKNVKSRLSIAKFGAKGGTKSNTVNVNDVNGEEITLKIKKKRDVKFPRVNKNQMVDGARARAQIKLANDGSVDHVKILESTPSKEFGEALEKAVEKWIFTPPKGVASENIPPFEYSMVFYVKRL